SVLFEHASALVLDLAATPFPFTWDAVAPDVAHDVLGWVGIEVMRGRERPAQPDFVANELVNENPPAQAIGQLAFDPALAGEILDLACRRRSQAEIALRLRAEESPIGLARAGVDRDRDGIAVVHWHARPLTSRSKCSAKATAMKKSLKASPGNSRSIV